MAYLEDFNSHIRYSDEFPRDAVIVETSSLVNYSSVKKIYEVPTVSFEPEEGYRYQYGLLPLHLKLKNTSGRELALMYMVPVFPFIQIEVEGQWYNCVGSYGNSFAEPLPKGATREWESFPMFTYSDGFQWVDGHYRSIVGIIDTEDDAYEYVAADFYIRTFPWEGTLEELNEQYSTYNPETGKGFRAVYKEMCT